jgi:N6-L-threonylcarbamoyladenine synthase
MLVLGIETSCDETGAAVLRDGRVLSNLVVSQVDIHSRFGGVVPELASRKHIEAISIVIEQALEEAGVELSEIDGVAVTRGPGLIGALLVGLSAAKGIALSLGIPLIGVNHLHGHLFAAQLEGHELEFPFVGLVVSGGHTTLFKVNGPFDIAQVGATRDDAAGEAFDKVAKLLGLGYPGGISIERAAARSGPHSIRFPRALMEKGNFEFSFSGLKTSALKHVSDNFGYPGTEAGPGSFHPLDGNSVNYPSTEQINAICSAFQEAIIEVLCFKALEAGEIFGEGRLIVSGGVAANRALREKMSKDGEKRGVQVVFPSPELCSDNGAMIAARGWTLLEAGMRDELDIDAKSRW